MAWDASATTFRFSFGEAAAPSVPDEATGESYAGREEFPELHPPSAGWSVEEVSLGGCVRSVLKAGALEVAAAAASVGAATGASDLLPGRYEGGCKLWECGVDLARLLAGPQAPPLAGVCVLELGCGHGLPGCVAALRGAASVTWQDYNTEVLHQLTAPAALANLARCDPALVHAPPHTPVAALRFFSGDWGHLHALLPFQSYDLILTADTIYAPATMPRLLSLLTHCLSPTGVALVAAKSFYFGVGGGTEEFRGAVRAGGVLQARTVDRQQDGASNVREILELKHL